ncbi:hypothetical protein G7072_18395 [Nocardioides sp. HDW12B]|uniref:hypothetical protein n=1 Tax=Nocardioides sp. HDW12B TaxID=2714939 RepID=UPI00140C5AE0|nr:hypothetical protein [Nocardioides sp. HDW12B]QIK68052.1 hypothetical protein G7072_18395 [Nocardioides sp. HDW12B]
MARPDSFLRSVAPLALTGVLAAVATYALEVLLTGESPADRAADPDLGLVLALHRAGAVVVSLAALWFLRGLWSDRQLLRGRDDRLTGEYLAAGLLGTLFSALAGTPVGVAVCSLAVLLLAVVRRDAADPEGPPGRDLRNAAFVALAGGMLHLGVVETFDVWAQWRLGLSEAEELRAAYADSLGADVVGRPLLVVATVAALAVPAAIVRHRNVLHHVRFTALAVCASPVAVGAMAGSTVLVGIGVGSFLLALALSWRSPYST